MAEEQDETLDIEMTDEEIAKLKSLAEAAGMTIDEFVNDLLRKALEDGTFADFVDKTWGKVPRHNVNKTW